MKNDQTENNALLAAEFGAAHQPVAQDFSVEIKTGRPPIAQQQWWIMQMNLAALAAK